MESLGAGPDCTKCCSSNSSTEFMFDDYNHRLIVGSLVAFISITGTSGNALVIIAVLVSRKLWTTTNAFVVNLGLSDLLCCIALSVNVYTTVYGGELEHPSLPQWFCMSVSFAIFLGFGACIVTLSLIAINRYFKITKSVATYQKVYRPRFIALMVAVSWIYPFILICVSFAIDGSGQYGYSEKYRVCFRDTSGDNSSIVNRLGGLLLVIPTFVVTLVAYALIYHHVSKHNKKRLKTVQTRFDPSANDERTVVPVSPLVPVSPQIDPTTIATRKITPPSPGADWMPQNAGGEQSLDDSRTNIKPSSPHTGSSSPEERIRKLQMAITKSLFIIVCMHIVLMLPFAIVILTRCSDFTLPWIFVLFVATPAFNPLIYGLKHPHFRMVFKSMITCRDIPQPSRLGRCMCFSRTYYV